MRPPVWLRLVVGCLAVVGGIRSVWRLAALALAGSVGFASFGVLLDLALLGLGSALILLALLFGRPRTRALVRGGLVLVVLLYRSL
jgi:hypothetical protein